ncbi:hypothetical protein H8356DRAFT_1324323 [Neocallimastix lanati (nom. inval.)]|nr:hypothetical protein H8356DRAFT_1324323 [Neocallimastix sp. JGI-2020a]
MTQNNCRIRKGAIFLNELRNYPKKKLLKNSEIILINNKENSTLNNIKDTSKSNPQKSFYPKYSYFSSSMLEITQILYDVGTKIISPNEFYMKELKKTHLLNEYDIMGQKKNRDSLISIIKVDHLVRNKIHQARKEMKKIIEVIKKRNKLKRIKLKRKKKKRKKKLLSFGSSILIHHLKEPNLFVIFEKGIPLLSLDKTSETENSNKFEKSDNNYKTYKNDKKKKR